MIYFGPLYRREQEAELMNMTRIAGSNAANAFQWGILDGLRDLGQEVRVISALPVGTWPRHYRRAVLPTVDWTWNGAPCREVGCVNLPFLKQWTRFRGARRIVRELRGEKVLLCTTYMPFLWALSRLDPSNDLTVIVTDLPEFADLHRVSRLGRWLRRLNNRMVYRFLKRADRFVVLTEQMKQPLKVGKRPCIVMEGIYSPCDAAAEAVRRERAVLYTGRLNECYGLGELLEAFRALADETAQLWICGSGEMEPQIRAAARADSRIQFRGFLPREQARVLQRRAAVLVNPRRNTEAFTKYSFPSKTMEYMASGTPVLMYKLDGVPDCYDPYLNYVRGDDVASLTAALEALLDTDPAVLARRARDAREFIVTRKNGAVQAGRILELMER